MAENSHAARIAEQLAMAEEEAEEVVGEDAPKVTVQYLDAVQNEEMRIVAIPYEGDYQEVEDEWEVRFERRPAGTREWRCFATDFATGIPEVQIDVE